MFAYIAICYLTITTHTYLVINHLRLAISSSVELTRRMHTLAQGTRGYSQTCAITITQRICENCIDNVYEQETELGG